MGTDFGKYEDLWLTSKAATRGCVYALYSFAIVSLRFLLTSATDADFLVEISKPVSKTSDFTGAGMG